MSKSFKVSIVVPTYNQEKFIRQALDSFLIQKTDFSLEIIVADDASSDATPDIIKEYAERHPGIIKPVLRKQNVGVWKNFLGAFQAATGKYIALCEGDDYWTDPTKLKRQIDFLELNAEYTVCFHPVRVFHENKEKKDFIYPKVKAGQKFNLIGLLNENYIQTNSVVYRAQAYKDVSSDILPVDWYFHLYHAQFGKIGFINRVMSDYRKHAGGVWWNADKDIARIWERYGMPHLSLYVEILKLYGKDSAHKKIIHKHIAQMYSNMIEVDQKRNTGLVRKAINSFPDTIETVLVEQHASIVRAEDIIVKQEKAVNKLQIGMAMKVQALAERESQLQLIKSSRFWKLRNSLVGLIGKKAV